MIFSGRTDVGKKRLNNQDSFFAEKLCENAELLVVCDGMGGANGGNVASALAAETFVNAVRERIAPFIEKESGELVFEGKLAAETVLTNAVEEANSAVFSRAGEDIELDGMGTTLVAALSVGSKVWVVNVGDSRLYLLSGGDCVQITHDHSFVQYLVDIGQITPGEAENHPNKNIITRAVGCAETVEADISELVLDSFPAYLLLCSDGLSNELKPKEIVEIVFGKKKGRRSFRLERPEKSPAEGSVDGAADVSAHGEKNGESAEKTESDAERSVADQKELDKKADALVSRANANGGRDNVTVVLAKYDGNVQ